MKFTINQVIMTDDGGYLMLKELLPEGSILWSRSVGEQVAICVDDKINLEHLQKELRSLYRNLRY